MKITKLQISNFKSIGTLELDDLPDLIVIAGPNGSGKTALFDAIRVFKESIAGYSINSPGNHWVSNLLNQIGPVVSVGSDSATIEAWVKVSEVERAAIEMPDEHDGILKAQVTIAATPTGHREQPRLTSHGNDSHLLRKLFGEAYRPGSGIGVMDHIGPDRRFNPTQVGSLTFSSDQIEGDLHRLVWNSNEKFAKLSEDLVWMRVVDLQEESNKEVNPHRYIDGVRAIFQHFLPDKEFVGVDIAADLSRPPRISVRSSGVEHDINQLSSGQREILMTYTQLQKLRPTESIILFDEPELHLHPALQRRVISHLQQLLEGGGNQIWVITHSEEIVNSAPFENLFSMTGLVRPSIVPVKDRADRIELMHNLGASVAVQLSSPKILFVEGESDAELLPIIAGEMPSNVSLVSTNGKGNLMRLTPTAMRLLEESMVDGQFFMIRDRDVEDDPSMIDELEKKYEGHFFRWDRYHIENYLLDSLAIAAVLEDDPDLRNLPPAGDIPSLIKQLADNAKSEVVALRMQAQLNNRFRTRINLDLQGDTIRGLQTSLTRRKQQLESALEDGRLEEEFNELSRQVDAVWAEGWQSLCVGRRVLKEFHRQVLQGQLGYEMFRNRVARKIHTLNRVPVRVSEVLEAVSR